MRMTSATPRLAPEDTPSVNGLASGFLNTVCICRPASPRAVPTIMAVSTLGSRMSMTMVCHELFSASPPSRTVTT